jgi:predicted DNA-binding antitoxin AbrB/MazE fold protein
MKHILDAIYEKGVFRPLTRPGLVEGQHVHLAVETARDESPDDLLELASQVYQGLTNEQLDQIECIALDRRGFFAPGNS